MPKVKRIDLAKHMDSVVIRLRSLDDPAISALLLTEGTYDVGIDPKTKARSIALRAFGFTCELHANHSKLCSLLSRRDATSQATHEVPRTGHHD